MTERETEPPASAVARNGWHKLGTQLRERTVTPFSHVTFVFYFLFGVVALGGLGVWIELGRWVFSATSDGGVAIRTAIATFFPALIGSASLQMIIEENNDRRLRSFAYMCGITFAAVALILGLSNGLPDWLVHILGFSSSLAALWIWWIANALNPAFRDEINLELPLGGSVNQSPTGTLGGFRS